MKTIYTQVIKNGINLDGLRNYGMSFPLEISTSDSVELLEEQSKQYILNTIKEIEKVHNGVNYKDLFNVNNVFLAEVSDGEYVFGYDILERPTNISKKLSFNLCKPISENLKFSLVVMEKTNSKSLKDLVKTEKRARLNNLEEVGEQ